MIHQLQSSLYTIFGMLLLYCITVKMEHEDEIAVSTVHLDII